MVVLSLAFDEHHGVKLQSNAGESYVGDPKLNADARWEHYSDSLRLDQQQFNDLVELRNRLPASVGDSSRRTSRRLRMAGHHWVPAEMKGPTGEVSRIRVYPIDISAGGMSFIVGLFVHRGSEWTLTLYVNDGEMVYATGAAVRCEFIKGRAHEVGLRFEPPFDMALLSPPGAAAQLAPPPGFTENPPAPTVPQAVEVQPISARSVPAKPGERATETAMIEIKQATDDLLLTVKKFADNVRMTIDKATVPKPE